MPTTNNREENWVSRIMQLWPFLLSVLAIAGMVIQHQEVLRALRDSHENYVLPTLRTHETFIAGIQTRDEEILRRLIRIENKLDK